jgi:hypothetical protein
MGQQERTVPAARPALLPAPAGTLPPSPLEPGLPDPPRPCRTSLPVHLPCGPPRGLPCGQLSNSKCPHGRRTPGPARWIWCPAVSRRRRVCALATEASTSGTELQQIPLQTPTLSPSVPPVVGSRGSQIPGRAGAVTRSDPPTTTLSAHYSGLLLLLSLENTHR